MLVDWRGGAFVEEAAGGLAVAIFIHLLGRVVEYSIHINHEVVYRNLHVHDGLSLTHLVHMLRVLVLEPHKAVFNSHCSVILKDCYP